MKTKWGPSCCFCFAAVLVLPLESHLHFLPVSYCHFETRMVLDGKCHVKAGPTQWLGKLSLPSSLEEHWLWIPRPHRCARPNSMPIPSPQFIHLLFEARLEIPDNIGNIKHMHSATCRQMQIPESLRHCTQIPNNIPNIKHFVHRLHAGKFKSLCSDQGPELSDINSALVQRRVSQRSDSPHLTQKQVQNRIHWLHDVKKTGVETLPKQTPVTVSNCRQSDSFAPGQRMDEHHHCHREGGGSILAELAIHDADCMLLLELQCLKEP